jgi:hypothetical protein
VRLCGLIEYLNTMLLSLNAVRIAK